MRRRSTRCSRSRSCRPSTSATRDGIPRRWLRIVKQAIRTVLPALQRAADGQGIRARDVRAGGAGSARSSADAEGRLRVRPSPTVSTGLIAERDRRSDAVGPIESSNGPESRCRQDEVRALRREGRLGAARRGALLPRLLGQEDRGRGDRRARVRAQALHPRAQRREVPRLPLDASSARAASSSSSTTATTCS